jgi:hypothetical protein
VNAPASPQACAEHEVAISLHAAGALEADEAAGLEAHIQGCAACRAVLDASARALGLARLGPVTEPERRALSDLAARTLRDLRAREHRWMVSWRVGAVAAVAALLVASLASPIWLRKSQARIAADQARQWAEVQAHQAEVEAARWRQPDLDELWDATDVLDLEPRRARATYVDAALVSYDAGVGD